MRLRIDSNLVTVVLSPVFAFSLGSLLSERNIRGTLFFHRIRKRRQVSYRNISQLNSHKNKNQTVTKVIFEDVHFQIKMYQHEFVGFLGVGSIPTSAAEDEPHRERAKEGFSFLKASWIVILDTII